MKADAKRMRIPKLDPSLIEHKQLINDEVYTHNRELNKRMRCVLLR